MKKGWLSIICTLAVVLGTLLAPNYASASWNLVWSDEFNGPNGSGMDTSKWGFDTGAGGWGNNELEYYTNRTQNAHIENGSLVIQANKENYNGSQYTSARLLTKNTFKVQYGKIEMRAKLPYGQGIWPAFWMLGSNIDSAGWPNCGEIDIMENVGKTPNSVYGTIHGPGYSGGNGISAAYSSPQGFSKDYHTYGIEWEPNVIRFYVDGNLYKTTTSADVNGKQWVFNQPFFLLLNLAVGGNWPGNPDGSTVFPQKYYIDYVRVYQQQGTPVTKKTVALKAAANGKYVTAENYGNSPLIANRTTPQQWEQFELIDLGNSKIALKAIANNKYVSADNYGNSPLIANRDSVSAWETFQVVTMPDGKKALKSLANGSYVCAENYGNGALIANRPSVSQWEEFDIIPQ